MTAQTGSEKRRRNRWIVGFGLLATLAVFCVWFGYDRLMTYSPDRLRYPVRGIDVSRHQKQIDWTRVAADDVTFAILKATEGGDWVDPQFSQNLEQARSAGLTVGAYHFYRFNKTGEEQARNFLRVVPPHADLLPPVVDIEFSGNGPDRPSVEELRRELAAYLDLVETAYGKPAVIYIIGEALDIYREALPDRTLWVRSLLNHPGHENWLYWQYHNMGRVDGIVGDVDLNVLQGGQAELDALRKGSPQ